MTILILPTINRASMTQTITGDRISRSIWHWHSCRLHKSKELCFWFRKTMNNLGIKLEEYWKEMRYRKNKENPNSITPLEENLSVHLLIIYPHPRHIKAVFHTKSVILHPMLCLSKGSQIKTGCSVILV